MTRSELQSLNRELWREETLRCTKPIYDNVIIYANRRFKTLSVEITHPSTTSEVLEILQITDPYSNSIKVYLRDIQGCLELLKELFPDSKVELKETWVDINPTNRVLKKSILIDWS